MSDKIAPLVLISAALALIVALSAVGGCSLDEAITVDVPPTTRQHFAENLEVTVPAEVSLRDARILRTDGDRRFRQQVEAMQADHVASNDALDAEIADGSFVESLIGSAVNTGLETYLPVVGTVPGGAILSTLLAGLGAWFLPRPGEKKKIDAAYDMGRAETLDSLAKVK